MRRINQAGLDLIKEFEGLRLSAYLCSAGVPTIGWGHTKTARMGTTITREQAETLLREDVRFFEQGVESALRGIKLSDNQFSALVSLCFNVGLGALAPSNTIRRALMVGDYSIAAKGILLWDKVDGKPLPGLTRRREAEMKLFLKRDTARLTPSYLLILDNTKLKLTKPGDRPRMSSELNPNQLIDAKRGTFLEVDAYEGLESNHYRVVLNGREYHVFREHARIYPK